MAPTEIARRVQRAIASAVLEVHEENGVEVTRTRFDPRDLAAVCEIVTSPESLLQVIRACEQEMYRQVGEARSIEGARAALDLQSRLTNDRPVRRYVMLHDGSLVPSDDGWPETP
ncbi:hypothetical protein [Nocardioides sp. KR10-350]|uniref:hypothetical protein n=1 Tax=Nocardioides cheoyonin TaxID=3156615 RepID=UPI0032B33663